MNQKNVDALVALLEDHYGPIRHVELRLGSLAAFLASRGVLVPSALTPEQIDHACMAWPHSELMDDTRGEVLARLEQIAKGG